MRRRLVNGRFCSLDEWLDEKVYTVEDLVKALKIGLPMVFQTDLSQDRRSYKEWLATARGKNGS